MKKPLLFLGALAVFALSLSINACGGKKQIADINGPGSGGGGDDGKGNVTGEKPSFDVPPHFDPSQFIAGQWVQWKKKSTNGHQQCERWTLVRIEAFSIGLKGQLSTNCKDWSPSYAEHITFDLTTGKVKEHLVSNGTQLPVHGHLLNQMIDMRWYGSSAKVKFKKGQSEIHPNLYSAFQLDGLKQHYFNQPDHPFHAIAIQFAEENDGIKWQFSFDQSEPPLPIISSKN